ncbi:MAG: NAD(P)-dependent oxidoreductase [Bacilli bacterium]|nr:NAD(P)-dependent oxidoreductase [Bacilli bacterium]
MNVAFIGLGIMGMPMATNVAKKYSLVGYDVVAKETPFPFATSYEECCKADVIITMVPKNEHVLAVYGELKKFLRPGTICIDMSTISPMVSANLAKELKAQSVDLLDCPVVKSQPAAVKGELGIYVGGDPEVFAKVRPILECMGKNIIYMGDNGSGLLMKILHNALVGEIQNGVNEVLGLAKAKGLDLNDVVTALGYGGAQCFYLDTKAKNIINGEFPTAFSVENMNKDVHFAQEVADDAGKAAPALRNVVKVYEKAMAKGYAKEDFSASYKAVNED